MKPPSTSGAPPTAELVAFGAPVELRDGSRVRIRQIRSSDRELLSRGFEHLSPESRYRRFLSAMPRLNQQLLSHLARVDHHEHEAMIAVAEETGEGVGIARYVRDRERPEVAEVAVTVIDDWHGRGLGTLLLEVISARARDEGITTLRALMLATNREMFDLLSRLGRARIVDREIGTVEVEVHIPEFGVAPELAKLLRIAAGDEAPPKRPLADSPARPPGSDAPHIPLDRTVTFPTVPSPPPVDLTRDSSRRAGDLTRIGRADGHTPA